MKIGVIIQARMSSTRLPEKVMKELPFGSGVTVLEQVIRRVKQSKKIDEIIIATTTDLEDNQIVKIAEKEKIKWFKGSKDNVLERYYLAAKENGLDVVVRITSDCPCIDAEVIDDVINLHFKSNSDYTSNSLVRTFPHGLDTEVFSFKVLEEAYRNATEKFEKEHVTPYIYKTNKDNYKLSCLEAEGKFRKPEIRITIDTKKDYTLLCSVYDYLYEKNNFFGIKEITELFENKPWLYYINEEVAQKKIFDNLNDEKKEAAKILDMQELVNASNIIKSTIKI